MGWGPRTMTRRRRQVLEAYVEAVANGEPIQMTRLARECGMSDYRHARRIVGDLRKMGAVG